MSIWIKLLVFASLFALALYLSKKIAETERLKELVDNHSLKIFILLMLPLWGFSLYISTRVCWNILGIVWRVIMFSSLGGLSFEGIKNVRKGGERLER